MERTTTRTYYPVQAGHLGAARSVLVPIVMRIDYRNYRQPVVIWTGLGDRRPRARRRAVRPPDERRDALAGCRPLGVQPSELAKIAVIIFIAALLERRMDRIDEPSLLAAADRRRRSAASSR